LSLTGTGDLIAALTWPIDVQQELREMQDEPDVVTDYASLLRAQVEYKASPLSN
jgi:replication fork protection complex subunit Tof1/Swi1